MMSPALALVAAAVGACGGSYVTTAALRSVRGEQAWHGRSHCDACRAGLTYLQTAPVVSYIGLRGACALCGARIDPTHLIGEAIGGGVVGLSFLALPPWQASLMAALGLTLLAAGVVDAKVQRLPDLTTLIVGVCAAGLALMAGVQSFLIGLAAGALTFLVLEACRRLFALTKGRSGLGFGDVKLAAALAFWLGIETPWMIMAASLGGLGFVALTRPREPRISFGPFIAASAWIIGFAGEARWWPSPM